MRHRSVLIASGACGIASVCLLAVADVVGAASTPGYSIVSQPISELIEIGAPNKAWLDVLFLGYHGLVVPFALGLHAAIDGGSGSRIGPALLAAAGGLGVVLTLYFPCDPGCEPFVTLRGTMHIAIAIPIAFAILFAILAFAPRLSRDERWGRPYAAYSRATFAAGIGLAVPAVLFAESSFVGVLQRILTAGYLQWYVVMAIGVIRRNMRPAL